MEHFKKQMLKRNSKNNRKQAQNPISAKVTPQTSRRRAISGKRHAHTRRVRSHTVIHPKQCFGANPSTLHLISKQHEIPTRTSARTSLTPAAATFKQVSFLSTLLTNRTTITYNTPICAIPSTIPIFPKKTLTSPITFSITSPTVKPTPSRSSTALCSTSVLQFHSTAPTNWEWSRGTKIKFQNLLHELRPHKPKGEKIGKWKGHNFWEWIAPDQPPDAFPRRYVEYENDVPVPHLLPELWTLWLRNSIKEPPTDEQLIQYEERRKRYSERIQINEARDAKLRFQEQLQRKLSSELNHNAFGGEQNRSTETKYERQDPNATVQQFVNQMEEDLKQMHEPNSPQYSSGQHQHRDQFRNFQGQGGPGTGPRKSGTYGGMPDFGFQMNTDGRGSGGQSVPPGYTKQSTQEKSSQQDAEAWDPSKPRKFDWD